MLKSESFLIILLLVVVLLLAACAPHTNLVVENDVYTITQEDGRYLLKMKNSDFEELEVAKTPTFSSLSEMRKAIIAGTFTKEELQTIQRSSKNEDGEIEICDINNLYIPVLPKGICVSQVLWHGKEYGFHLEVSKSNATSLDAGDNATSGQYGSMVYVTEKTFIEDLREFTEFTQNENIEILSQLKDPMSGGVIYTYRTYYGYTFQDVLYKMSDEGKTIYVHEKYDGKFVTVWGDVGGVYFILNITPEKRVDPNWVFSFGLTPYVENTETE